MPSNTFSSRRIVVEGESAEDLQALRVHWMRQLQPHTPAEREVAEEVVAAEWRVRRCQEAEASMLSAEIRKLNSESIGEAFKSLAENSRALDLLHRYMTAAQRDFDRALNRFNDVVADRRAEERRDIVEAPLSPQGYKSKWGLDPDFAIISYCGRLTDVLPNEPELPGILTAALPPPKPPTPETTMERA